MTRRTANQTNNNNNMPSASCDKDPMDGFVFRLGSGAGRRPTTTSRTILNYYPWMTPWLIISAQLCWQPAAADSLPPVPAADLVTPRSIRHPGQDDSLAAPPTEAPYFNHLNNNVQNENDHGNQWSNISFAISTLSAFLLGIMCFGMMDYGHQPANAAPRWHGFTTPCLVSLSSGLP